MLHRRISKNLNRDQGFSLIEVLVAATIIALIAAAAYPFMGNRLKEVKIETDKTNIRLIQSALDMYYQNHGTYPVNSDDPADKGFYALDRRHELVLRNYLREIPASPFEIDPGYHRDEKTVKSLAEGIHY